jgi:hypothetical protein
MFYVSKGPDRLADEICEPETLVKAVPRFGPRFDAIQEMQREAEEDFAQGGRLGGNDPNFRLVASIPDTLLGRLTDPECPAFIPYFLENKKVFFRWLDRHPEYQTYRRRRQG